MSGLELEQVSVRYDATLAVREVTLAVPVGSVLALVGPSGCGKSSLLRLVAGLVEPATGVVRWNGADLTHVPTHERDIGLMFQDHALFTHRSVAENVGFGLKMAGMASAERRRRVDDLLELVGLAGFAVRPIEGLSGGEAQRVALARALAPEPKLLLLDEPLASLDRARRVELNAELARLLRELNQTAIYVTHDQEEAFAVADEIGVMGHGQLLRLDTPTEVWRDPRSEVVARFVGHETIIERDGQRFAVPVDAVSLASAGSTEFVGEPADDSDQYMVFPGEPADGSSAKPEDRWFSRNTATDSDQYMVFPGRVTGCGFQGDRYEVSVDVDHVTWRVFHNETLTLGQPVYLHVDSSRLAPISDDRDGA